MPNFKYKALDSSGAKVEGSVEKASSDDAIRFLESEGLYTLSITEEKAGISLFSSGKVSLADLEFLTAELSLLLASGVKIDKGLDIIRKTKAKPALADMLKDISKRIKGGESLSEACKAHPKTFDKLYCNLIELGEASGNLTEVFADLANDLKFKRDLRSKIISSLSYPAVIFFVCILSVLFIFNFIIPKMAEMFREADNLPWYTEMMLSLSDWMVNYQWFLIVGTIVSVGGFISLLKHEHFTDSLDRLALRLPLVSYLVISVERIRFNSGLAMMIRSGVAIDKALKLSTGNVKNHVLRHQLDIAQQKVNRGSALSPALSQTELYPDFFVSLLEVGEESGHLEKVFSEIASRSRQEFESWTQKVTTLLEPLMILFMGGIVGGVVVVMLLSMVSMNDIGL
ncbi:secretion system protein [Pseudoalteromonas sp. GCY]|uniref:type II secretion system F family protein n=1 Tax=Pseudoalteromonas sp. GCY TaxID=2003316 RepID=UPI000BFEE4F9|nr:type II secretion system F family protein [Pseudoalteromonas sp. GCY]PHI38624.1 secretion system protein [Pseudoalteromonas sp. GCY]QQQ67717.1 type II secretion system F family protein [Pseudoalteromonas sp. GCY]